MSSTFRTEIHGSLRWLRTRWSQSFFAGAPPVELGFYRILFYGFVSYFLAFRPTDVTRWAEVPDVFWTPTSFFRLLHLPVLLATTLVVALWAWRASLVLALIGLFTRLSMLVAFVLGFYLLGLPHNFGKVNHNDAIVVLGLAIFALSRAGDVWSLDAIWRARSGAVATTGASGNYSWPVALYRLMLSLVPFSAGVAKARGAGLVAWVLSNNLYDILIAHHYSHSPPTRVGLLLVWFPWICQVLAGGAVILELSTPLLVMLPLVLRTLLAASVVAMLVGFWLMMGVFFQELIILFVIFFFPWKEVAGWLVDRSWPPPLAVLYDGSCGLCNRTIAILRALDVFDRLEVRDVLGDWPAVSARWPILDQPACLEDMHVITNYGRIYTGFYGYRALAWYLPLAWLVLPLLYTPGVPFIGVRVYSFVARRRHTAGCPPPM
ncbi:MAG TPA: DCC1-like thiol-disulfide oxidoreductase family protein [Methylomirabilota bacterium]|nr:DCC1-like thiol-disulfide oxidoreductase family protein [Methylomirabilota bacterium]